MAIGCAAQGPAALLDRVGIVAVREKVNEFLTLRAVHLVLVGDCLAKVDTLNVALSLGNMISFKFVLLTR